jgi:arginyl-tRNA synthetase
MYDLSVVYNAFYHECNISAEKDKALAASWTQLSKITLQALEIFARIISVEIPERM